MIGKLLQKPTERLGGRSKRAETASSLAWSSPVAKTLDPLVVMGASTGGPQALAEVLSGFQPNLRPGSSLSSMSTLRLPRGWGSGSPNKQAGLCEPATEGHPPAAGGNLLSGTDDHLILGEDRLLHYSVEPRESSYRPSVDVFFDSADSELAQTRGWRALDRYASRTCFRPAEPCRLGWRTIAQDESSSVVWGMPKARCIGRPRKSFVCPDRQGNRAAHAELIAGAPRVRDIVTNRRVT